MKYPQKLGPYVLVDSLGSGGKRRFTWRSINRASCSR